MHFLFLLLLPLALFSQEMLTRTQVLMGTYVSITLPKQHNAQITRSFETLKDIETSLSNFEPTASLYLLNQNNTIAFDATLAEAIQLSQKYYDETDGFFDITIGSISKELYHFEEEIPHSATKEELKNAHLDIHGIHLNTHTISTDKNIHVDLGGMGKGYGVDKVASLLAKQHIDQGVIALSGDIRCLNRCEISLQSPFDEEQIFATITSKHPQLSISTSGTYRRYATVKTEHHLINPKTAQQGKEFVSVSLFTTANNAKIDAYATAISVMPRDKALDFIKSHTDIAFILVDTRGNILLAHTQTLLEVEWLPHKENANSPSKSKKEVRYNTNAKALIHPDTSHPNEMAK